MEVSDAIGIDPLQIDPVLDTLCELDWVGRLEESRAIRATCCSAIRRRRWPSRSSPSSFSIRRPIWKAVWRRADFARMRLAEILERPLAPS